MPFQPGQSGNPEGRRVDKPWRDAIRRAIKRREADDPQALEKLADKLLSKVLADDVPAMKELGDRLDGKATQPIEHSGSLAVTHEEALEQLERPGTPSPPVA